MVQMFCSERIGSIASLAIAATAATILNGAALAQDSPLKTGSAQSMPTVTQSSLVGSLHQLTDPGGLRSRLEKAGLQFTFSYYSDPFGNRVGGVLQGSGYDGRFGVIVDADLEKLVGWTGATLHASFHQIHGTQFSARNLGNLMTVSGIEAPPSMRLFNLWIEQKIGDLISLRVGQFTAAQEFLVSQSANLFVNSTFGWPASTAQNLPSGGPAYPEATPGARLQFFPTNQFSLKAAIFNGDPAGPGSGNPVQRDPYGVAFRVNDPPLLMTELAYTYGQEHASGVRENPNQEGSRRTASRKQPSATDLPGAIKIGAMVHTGVFADQRLDTQGSLLAISGGLPLQHRGNYAIYGVVDQMLWRSASGSDQSLSVFLRGTWAPSTRNLIDLYVDGGVTLKGPIASRPDDTMGIAFAYGRISPWAAAFDRDLAGVSGTPMPVRNFEAAVEWTYQWQVADNWFFQPNIQYIIHPGGNVPDPGNPAGTSPIRDALVLGMRTTIKF